MRNSFLCFGKESHYGGDLLIDALLLSSFDSIGSRVLFSINDPKDSQILQYLFFGFVVFIYLGFLFYATTVGNNRTAHLMVIGYSGI